MNSALRNNIQFSLLQGFYWSSVCVSSSYYVTYFSYMGYDDLTIGIMSALMMGGAFIAQPIVGRICSKLPRIKPVLIVMIIIAAAANLLLISGEQSFTQTLVATVTVSACIRLLTSVIDAWIMRNSMTGVKIDFGFTRGMGSLFYAIAAIIVGRLIAEFDVTIITYGFVLTCALMIGVIAWIKEQPAPPNAVASKHDRDMHSLFTNRSYVVLLVGLFLANLGAMSTFNYMARLFQEIGADDSMFGLALFVTAVSELPVMFVASRIGKRFSPRLMLLIAFIGYFLKIGLSAVAPTPGLLVLAQAMQAIAGGLHFAFAIQYLATIVKPSQIFTAQATVNAVTISVSGILGSLLAGYLSTLFGVRSMYALALIPIVLGFLLYLSDFITSKHTPVKQETF